MLASDLNNPEFVNPTNPDALLHVEFFWHEPIDKWASEEESAKLGKRVTVKRPRQIFVRIMKPGDNTSIIETPVREDHKARWPEKWLYWQMQEGLVDDGEGIPGWRLEDWQHMAEQPQLLREMKFLRFHTVEQIAGASDAQVQRLGIGGPGLREQAKMALREKLNRDVRDQISAKDKEVEEMRARMKKMEEQIAAMASQPAPEAKVRRKPGRKPKQQQIEQPAS